MGRAPPPPDRPLIVEERQPEAHFGNQQRLPRRLAEPRVEHCPACGRHNHLEVGVGSPIQKIGLAVDERVAQYVPPPIAVTRLRMMTPIRS